MAKRPRRHVGTDVNQLYRLPDTRDPSARASTGANVSEAEQAIVELRQLLGEIQAAVGEAHGVLKDLRIETRQARRIVPMIVAKRINKAVEEQLARLGEATERAMRDNVEKVSLEFGKLERALLGKDHEGRKTGKPTIPEYVTAISVLDNIMEGPDGQSQT